jgi:tetratricopeptide (TPR) repeat protein
MIASLINEGRYVRALAAIRLELEPNPEKQNGARLSAAEILALLESMATALPSATKPASLPADLADCLLQVAHELATSNRPQEALQACRAGLRLTSQNDALMLIASECHRSLGESSEAIAMLTKALAINPQNKAAYILIVNALLKLGRHDEAKNYADIASQHFPKSRRVQGLAKKHLNLITAKEQDVALYKAWELTCQTMTLETRSLPEETGNTIASAPIPIQYWSQGTPPADVERLSERMNAELAKAGIGEIQRFDKQSAQAWIAANNPIFTAAFQSAFHYAVEADIFRIAFATKQGCIWLDSDLVPKEGFVPAIREALRHQTSLLYLRDDRPWLTNAFFIAQADCPFFQQILKECGPIDLESRPKDRTTVQQTFGPGRYNKVFARFARKAGEEAVDAVENNPFVISISTNKGRLLLCNEANTVAMRPSFSLDYKSSSDGWKKAVPRR